MKKSLLSVFFVLACVLSGHSTTRYAKPSGSGGGTSWTDAAALSIVNSSSAGDTIYLAGGTYSPIDFTVSGSSGSIITVKRATAADHGTSTGWNAGTMDVQVVFSSNFAISSYTTVDGNLWSAPGLPSSYGILIDLPGSPNSGTTNRGIDARNGNDTIRNVEIAGPGFTSTVYETDGIEFGSNSLISGCKIHDMDTAIHAFGPGFTTSTIEYTTIYDIGSTDSTINIGTGPHPDVWYNGDGMTNTVFRYNVVANAISEGIFIDFQHSGAGSNMAFYGNLFFQGASQGGGCVPIEYTDSGTPTFGSVFVYNNTFVDWSKSNNRSGSVATLGSGSAFKNNLFVNAGNEWVTGGGGVGTMSYNGFFGVTATGTNTTTNATSPFVTSSSSPSAWTNGGTKPATVVVADGTPAPVGYDPTPYIPAFTPTGWPTTAGNDLGSPYDVDMNGHSLGNSVGALAPSASAPSAPGTLSTQGYDTPATPGTLTTVTQ